MGAMLGPTLTTPRLLLRPPAPEDFDAWAAFSQDEQTMRFLGGTQTRALAWRTFAMVAGAWSLQGFGLFSVIERETGRWIGRLGPWYPEGWPDREIAYSLVRDATGRGYASEGVRAALAFAFDTLGWTRAVHCIHPDNVASRRVAERVGAKNLGPGKLPPPLEELVVDLWGQSRDEWRAHQS